MANKDQDRARALDDARDIVAAGGADSLSRRPWQAAKQPLADGELVRFAAWAARDAAVDPQMVTAGLALLDSARAELDQIEAGLLFAARSAGMTFQEIGRALGLGSGQAAQQRLSRVLARLDED